MPATAAAGGGGIFTIAKMLLGNSAKIFAFVFVAFMIVSVASESYNKYEKSKDVTDIFVGVGKAIILPVMSSDKAIYDNVARFSEPDLKWYSKIMLWINIYGSASVMYFVYKYIILRAVTSAFTEGMNPSAAVHLGAIVVLFLMSMIYNSVTSGHFMIGFSGIKSLFIHFTVVFQPIISFGEGVLHLSNKLPDSNFPVFK